MRSRITSNSSKGHTRRTAAPGTRWLARSFAGSSRRGAAWRRILGGLLESPRASFRREIEIHEARANARNPMHSASDVSPDGNVLFGEDLEKAVPAKQFDLIELTVETLLDGAYMSDPS